MSDYVLHLHTRIDELKAEIDRLRKENANLWRTAQQMNEVYHALKGQLAKAREALATIAGWCDRADPKIIEDRACQALKETE